MELCLSLGGHEEPAERSDQNTTTTTKTTEFCMSLSIGPSCAAGTTSTPHRPPRHEAAAADKKQNDDDGDHIHVDDRVPLQLDLLLWPTSPCNRIQNAGVLSMNVINRVEEVVAAASSTHTNSGSSSFQIMDIGSNNHSKGSAGDDLNNNYHNVYNYKRRAHSAEAGDDEGERASNSRVGSDEEEDDIINGNTNTSRKKLRLSKEQSAFLEESFKEHHTLNPKQKLALAKQLSLRPRQVEVWFQNKRARTKLKQTEVDCEFLKRCCETLTEENRRLNKELQELRALKATHHSNPFSMQSPATTLTMCPSCERTATTANPASKTTNNTNNNNNNNKVESTSATKVQAAKFPPKRPSFYPFFQPKSHPSSAAS